MNEETTQVARRETSETLLLLRKISATRLYPSQPFNPSFLRRPGSIPPSIPTSPTSHQPTSSHHHHHLLLSLYLSPPTPHRPSPTLPPRRSSALSSPRTVNLTPPPLLLPRPPPTPNRLDHAQETHPQYLSPTLPLEQDAFRRRSTRTRRATDSDRSTSPSLLSLLDQR